MAGPVPRRALLGGIMLLSLVGCSDRELTTAPTIEKQSLYILDGPIVTDPGDAGDGICDATCTFREAVETAQESQTITFAEGLASPIQLTGDQIYIDKSLAISGPGADKLTIHGGQTGPNMSGSVIRIYSAAVQITGLTITGGYNLNEGGGIHVNYGALHLIRSVVTGNRAGQMGAGIYGYQSNITLEQSTISNNAANSSGAGIYITPSSTLTVQQSTISGNVSSYDGGGIASDWAPITLIESTVSGNSAGYEGGGIVCNGTGSTIINSTISGNRSLGYGGGGGIRALSCGLQVSHSTIVNNHAVQGGGGIHASEHDGTSVVVRNSIIWGNDNGGVPDDVASEDGRSHFTSLGYNLVGTVGAGNTFASTGDQVGVPLVYLGPLTQEPTRLTATHALQDGSPAIDAGACTDPAEAPVSADQRGVSRPQGSSCDIGAYELEQVAPPPPLSTFGCAFKRNPKNGQLTVEVSWVNADPGVTLIKVVDGRTLTRQQSPSADGVWKTSLKTGSTVLTYGVWGGASRKDASTEWVAAGTACTMLQ